TGVIHRDIKPANVMKTPEGRLLLSDFGLVKIIAESQGTRAQITGVGTPLGTPDYMAPEQGMGAEIDARADIYSLGVVLYQMVTGVVPFRGDLPMQVAMQHLHMPPPPPGEMRPDLPPEAEQAILRALAKRPSDRYARASDLSSAFRQALESAGVQLDNTLIVSSDTSNDGRFFKKRGLFDPMWQGSANEKPGQTADLRPRNSFSLPTLSGFLQPNSLFSSSEQREFTPLPSLVNEQADSTLVPQSQTRSLLSSFAPTGAPAQLEFAHAGGEQSQTFSPSDFPPQAGTTRLLGGPVAWQQDAGGPVPPPGGGNTTRSLGNQDAQTGAFPLPGQTGMLPTTSDTRALMVPSSYDGQGATTSMKLVQPVKVVQIPVAGEPGRFMTGFMPAVPLAAPPANPSAPEEQGPQNAFQKHLKILIVVAAVLLVLFGSGAFALTHFLSQQGTADQNNGSQTTLNATATSMARATATSQANTILSDPLTDNISNWPVDHRNGVGYAFKSGSYHLFVDDHEEDNSALAIYPNQTFGKQLGYTVTLWEIKGNNGDEFNWYGIFFRYSEKKKDGKTYQVFYALQITPSDKKYWFKKYDGSATDNQWESIQGWPFGKEYHSGLGPKFKNTVKVSMNGDRFTFTVNGKQIGTAKNGALPSGSIGMVVNHKGTEVAFSNMILTYN
ncbi:MAG: protein kinase, partial [Ktedonobacteraceae bacterium]|nr:protein kinase [Ktedonobacteraceae bacterium]